MSAEEVGGLIIGGLLLVGVIAGIFGSFHLDDKLHARRPYVLPFRWGYFSGIVALVCLPMAALGLFGATTTAEYVSVVYMLLVGVCGVFVLRRNRFAYLFLTILLGIPILWIVNGIYLSSRWQEMGVKSSGRWRRRSSRRVDSGPIVAPLVRTVGLEPLPQPQSLADSSSTGAAGSGVEVVNQVSPATTPAAPAEIYVAQNGQKEGPFTIAQIQEHLRSRSSADLQTQLYWQPGMDRWRPLPELAVRLRHTGALS